MKKILLVGIIILSTLSTFSHTENLKRVKSSKVDYSQLNQYEQANLLKEGRATIYTTLWRGGRKSGSSSPCKDLKYEKKPWAFNISDIQKESGMTKSFTISRNAYGSTSGIFVFSPKGTNKDKNGNYTDVTCWSTGKGYHIIVYGGGIYAITNDPYPTNDYCIISAFGKKSAKIEDLKIYTAPYVKLRKESQKKVSENAKKAREVEQQKYTIANKEIEKIDVIATHDEKFGIWSSLKFGIETTLKDGSKIKTSNIGGNGYLSDYNIEVIGVKSDIVSGYQVAPQIHKLKGDYILVEVSAKHDKTIKTERKIILNYKNSVKLYYQGGNGLTGPSANSGKNLRIEAKGIKHTETGEDLVQYNIYNLDGDLINSVRVRPDRSFFVSTQGGKGSNGNNGNAYNGANGGNITLIIDTNLKDYTFDYNTSGGNGGTTNNNSYNNGRNGRDGSFTKKTQSIKW